MVRLVTFADRSYLLLHKVPCGIHRSFMQLRIDVQVPARNAHPSRPWLSSWLDDGHIMPAARQVDIRRGGADESSIYLDVGTGWSGVDMCAYVDRRSRR